MSVRGPQEHHTTKSQADTTKHQQQSIGLRQAQERNGAQKGYGRAIQEQRQEKQKLMFLVYFYAP